MKASPSMLKLMRPFRLVVTRSLARMVESGVAGSLLIKTLPLSR